MKLDSESFDSKKIAYQWALLLPVFMRVLVWGALFSILFLLRSVFLLIFLTFVFAYIQANGVRRLESHIKNRTVRVVIVAVTFLAVLLSLGAFLVPRVKEQAKLFVDRFPSYVQTLDKTLIKLVEDYPMLEEVLMIHVQEVSTSQVPNLNLPYNTHDLKKSPAAMLLQQLFGLSDGSRGEAGVKKSLDTLRNIGGYLLTLGSAFLLSLLFSFLIVLDLPNITRSALGLAHTKLKFIYDEVAHSIYNFAVMFGRALEAQLFIAILNTFLTVIGVTILGIGEKAAFISVIVFLCSFIPVAGVFISSLPICLVALQESGFGLMVAAVVMITVIHMIEAYILNPKIYGHHLHMNPVVVLMILTISGKLFHVWGLVLGVPICTYIFGHAIRNNREDIAVDVGMETKT